MKQIITSLLDADLYKFSMQSCVLHRFPNANWVEYEFKCRSKGIDFAPYVEEIEEQIELLCHLSFKQDELDYLGTLRYLKSDYIEHLRYFKLNSDHVHVSMNGKDLEIKVAGSWWSAILFETFILSIVNEVYFCNTCPEIYSFATNPFIDQLSNTNWGEIIQKDASYRERLLGAAEAFQTGATLWGIITLCEALTQYKFYAVESWRTNGYGRTSLDSAQEIVLIPLIDGNIWTQWDQGKAYLILDVIHQLLPCNFVVSFGTPIKSLTTIPLSSVPTASGYSEYFHLERAVSTNQVNTPVNIPAGGSTRYWLNNNGINVAPFFAHLQTQEINIDLTGNIISVSGSDTAGSILWSNSVATPSVQVTATMYGAQ